MDLVYTIGIKVDPETYRLYKNELTGRQKEILINTLRQIIIQSVRKPESLQPSEGQSEITIKVEHIMKAESTEVLAVKKRIEKLERELAKVLEENASLKNQLDECRAQSQKPIQDIEKDLANLKKENEALKRELENYKYHATVIYVLLSMLKSSMNPDHLDKIIQYAGSRADKNLIEKAKLTAQNILR